MAAPSDRTYSPPLEECLKGEKILLSWKAVSSSLADPGRLSSPAVSSFLADQFVEGLLRDPAKVFEPPSAQSKAEFETKTAAINVTPAPNETFDLAQIKSDALWLSTGVALNEPAALRVVVAEFQARGASHLSGPLSAQDVANLHEIVGQQASQGAGLLSTLTAASHADAEAIWTDFQREESRRQRILQTYLSERRHFTAAAEYKTTRMLEGSTTAERLPEAQQRELLEKACPAWLSYMSECIKRFIAGPEANLQEAQYRTDALAVDWIRTCLTESAHAAAIMLQILAGSSKHTFAPPALVSQWFSLVTEYAFLDALSPADEGVAELAMPLKCLVCAVSMALLNIPRSMAFLDQDLELGQDEEAYLQEADVLLQIHGAIQGAADNSLVSPTPVVFIWTLLLHRMYSAYQERAERRDLAQNQRAQAGFELDGHPQPGLTRRNSAGSIISLEARSYDHFLVTASMSQDLQVVEGLAQAATAGGLVYDVLASFASCAGSGPEAAFAPEIGAKARCVFLDLLKFTFHFVGYKSEPLACLFAILSEDNNESGPGPGPGVESPADVVLQDRDLQDSYVREALNRYPYEYTPFTNMCKLLAARAGDEESSGMVTEHLLKTPTLTFILPEDFQEYQLVQEEENANAIQIMEDIPLFESGSSLWRRRPDDHEPFCLAAGSYGRFITDSGRLVMFDFEHSALALMGKRLEVYLSQQAHRSILQPLGADEVAETVSLLTALVRRETEMQGPQAGISILQETSKAVSRTRDVIAIVCGILDGAIQNDSASSEAASSITVLYECVRFVHTVMPLCPGRVWSYMARCELLNTEAHAGRLSRITGNAELSADRFLFLDSTIRLLSDLVDSAMESSVRRKVVIAKPGALQHTGSDSSLGSLWVGISDKILAQVALSTAQTAMDMFENSSAWRYTSGLHHSTIVGQLAQVLNKLVVFTYSIDDSNERLTECLAPAAGYVVDCFLSSSSAGLKFHPLLSTLLSALEMPESSGLYPRAAETLSSRLAAVLELGTSLVKAATSLNKPTTVLELQLFKASSLLARLCAVSERFRAPALGLLEAVVTSAEGVVDSEPPSLLGYLGPQISKSFLKLLSQLDRPFDRPGETTRLWKLLSTIVRSRQRWLASCLLTGSVPRDAFSADSKTSKTSRVRKDSVLAAARDRLQDISSMPSEEALAVLEFFTAAQNHWPWTIFAMLKDSAHVDQLRKYVRELKSSTAIAKTSPGEAANQARIAAYIAETFAMQLYHLRQTGQGSSFAQQLLQDLDYFLRDGIQVSGYNTSLHVNFAKNFAARYNKIPPSAFKRTPFAPRELGKQYYYALDLAQKMLDFDAGWVGPRDSGFRSEMEMVNLNLSLVDGQIALFHAWEFLLLELSVCLLPKNKNMAVLMTQVAGQCLSASHSPKGPEQIFISLSKAQANLALTLVQRLADASELSKEAPQLLGTLWTTLNGVDDPFGASQVEHYRTLLKTLYVILRGCRRAEASVAVTQNVLGILDRVVGQGFRTLVALIHEPDTTVASDDVALITAILQACLAVPGVDECSTQVLNLMASHDVLHVAMSLFSWSDRLADGGDPVYGELSLLFLLELSAVPAVAEQLALDGLLGHVTSARVANLMRRPNVSPFASAVGAQRCYNIWAKAVLPLMINILGALGATIAPEVAFVLNWFSGLLESSVRRFESPGASRTASRDGPRHITLLAVSEVHSLALLTRVLDALRLSNNRDIPEVPWDAASLLEHVEFLLTRPNLLRERLLPLGNREIEWRATKAAGGDGAESRLEEKVVSLLDSVKTILSEDVE
ncbi:hypothetical protein RB596_003004 [Gaeumannomyces avenae]